MKRMNGVDRDLAAHFTVIRKRGKCLYGPPIGEAFGEVPAECYLDSIRSDVAGAREEIAGNTLYLTLNLARVLAYRREGLVLSKKEGGEWGLAHLPDRYRPLLTDALEAYAEGGAMRYEPEPAADYASYMLGQIG